MWNHLPREWQLTFQLAWESFCKGSIPIGAIILDDDGNILSTGRNLMGENQVPNHRTAHAEAQCVRNLDTSRYQDYDRYHLYTTMEPCPMCLGTIVMGGIRSIHTAALDSYCGALHYLEEDPYLKGKAVRVQMSLPEAAQVQIVMQTYHEYRRYACASAVLNAFAKRYPREVELGGRLYRKGTLDLWVRDAMPFAAVYDHILRLLSAESFPS